MRATEQRMSDAIAKLEGDIDLWFATADDHENAHLVPLSFCWHNEEVVVATEARSRTAQNAERSGQARLALGTSLDVVIVDATASVVDGVDADPLVKNAYRGLAVILAEKVAIGFTFACGFGRSRFGARSMRSLDGPSCETRLGSPDDSASTGLCGPARRPSTPAARRSGSPAAAWTAPSESSGLAAG